MDDKTDIVSMYNSTSNNQVNVMDSTDIVSINNFTSNNQVNVIDSKGVIMVSSDNIVKKPVKQNSHFRQEQKASTNQKRKTRTPPHSAYRNKRLIIQSLSVFKKRFQLSYNKSGCR